MPGPKPRRNDLAHEGHDLASAPLGDVGDHHQSGDGDDAGCNVSQIDSGEQRSEHVKYLLGTKEPQQHAGSPSEDVATDDQ